MSKIETLEPQDRSMTTRTEHSTWAKVGERGGRITASSVSDFAKAREAAQAG